MAERTPVISIVECQGALEYSYFPDEMDYWLKRLGEDELRKQAHEQLDLAITRVIRFNDSCYYERSSKL